MTAVAPIAHAAAMVAFLIFDMKRSPFRIDLEARDGATHMCPRAPNVMQWLAFQGPGRTARTQWCGRVSGRSFGKCDKAKFPKDRPQVKTLRRKTVTSAKSGPE